ncbi:hypothetical protein [Arthrobacter sp. Edens01]|uniref:hypothetical protein n=1 Tax=Arthrobacter sp. Edens01 TaxID=1732020 RepID=UPI0006D947F4|nr:hypothetical protein [Arthrobacter sp. Edens01]KPN16120.1 hypothetical protein AO716_00320 [Arthrobacter sp. Edens01]
MKREKDLVDKDDGHPVRDPAAWPNNGLGLPSSRVEHSPVIPELKASKGVPLQDGAEMWRIDRDGKETLAAVYNRRQQRWISL